MDDKKAILELVEKYKDAIHTQDKESFKKIWTGTDNTLISITNLFEGIDSIYDDFLINGIRKHYSKIDLISENTDIHFIDEDHAIVIFKYHTECIRRETNEPYGIQGLETQIMQKINGQWKLVHIHYSK